MIKLDPVKAGEALGVRPLKEPVAGVSTDTRSLTPGDLFVALEGECFDGHDFVEAALAAGASGVIVSNAWWAKRTSRRGDETGNVYRVEDTLKALGSLAREVRRASKAKVFAITGSVGKTSTKDMLKSMLARVGSVVATTGNQNNEVGVPLTLFGVEADTQAVVVEMGMRGLGQIAELASIAEPDVGVITNIHPVHLELLGSVEQVARAKAELVGGIGPSGSAVVPADGGPLEPYLAGCACRVIRFGLGVSEGGGGGRSNQVVHTDVTGRLGRSDDGGYEWLVRWPEGEARLSADHMSGHAHENALAAAAACYAAGLPMEACLNGLSDLKLSEGRGQTTEVGGVCLVDDSYNANPAAVQAAVRDLVHLVGERGGRAVAVLGDMLELGSGAVAFHEQVGEMVAEAGVSVLWGVGPLSEATVRGFLGWCEAHPEKVAERYAHHVGSVGEIGGLISVLGNGDVVLVKGSRGVGLEKVVRRVLEEGKTGRWSGGGASVEVDSDLTGETRLC